MAKLRRVTTNLFIVAFLFIIAIDGFPSLGVFHNRAKEWIDPVIDKVGIWQGGWSVFALVVDNENGHYEANIEYDDGQVAHWRSPAWKSLSEWQRMSRFRERSYTEQMNAKGNEYLLPEFARYLADRYRPAAGVATKQVRITYHYFKIWPPRPGDYQPLSYPRHAFVKPLYEGRVP